MNCQEEDRRNGNGTVEDQNNRNVIQDHAEQAAYKREDCCSQQQPPLWAQLFAVKDGMEKAQKKAAKADFEASVERYRTDLKKAKKSKKS